MDFNILYTFDFSVASIGCRKPGFLLSKAIRWLNGKLGLKGVTRQRHREIQRERERVRLI